MRFMLYKKLETNFTIFLLKNTKMERKKGVGKQPNKQKDSKPAEYFEYTGWRMKCHTILSSH